MYLSHFILKYTHSQNGRIYNEAIRYDVVQLRNVNWCNDFISILGERTEGSQTVLQVARLCVRQVHFDRRTTARDGRTGNKQYYLVF